MVVFVVFPPQNLNMMCHHFISEYSIVFNPTINYTNSDGYTTCHILIVWLEPFEAMLLNVCIVLIVICDLASLDTVHFFIGSISICFCIQYLRLAEGGYVFFTCRPHVEMYLLASGIGVMVKWRCIWCSLSDRFPWSDSDNRKLLKLGLFVVLFTIHCNTASK